MFIQNNNNIISQKLNAKNITPLTRRIRSLAESLCECKVDFGDVISVDSSDVDLATLESLLKDLKPWRKGPFKICSIDIESEWNSFIKFNLIKNYLNINNKIVADIGCNNGYYAFKMLPLNPKKIYAFEPSAFCKMQFDLLNAFIKSDICFELLGLEDLINYDVKFDVIVCLGVIYHRTNPIDCLKILKHSLNKNGEILLDTLIVESSDEIVLSPLVYAKMKNVYFIPSISAFKNWLIRAGFRDIRLIATKQTTSKEQRKTSWISGESLEDFLDKNDANKTIEGYQAPIRAYFSAKV